jgi:hypothetical protein
MGDEALEVLIRRLDRIERLILDQKTVREWYGTEEFAEAVGKAEFTVREWCRYGRVRATKRRSGRGRYCSWAIPHEELLRYQREGLLPERRA